MLNLRKIYGGKIMNKIDRYLQFDDPTVSEFDLKVNEQFDIVDGLEQLDIKTMIEMPPELEIDWSSAVPVYLSLFVNLDRDQVPYKISSKISSYFKVDDEISNVDALQILQTDAATILLSYLRPLVSMMTAASGFPAMTLPMIDFNSED